MYSKKSNRDSYSEEHILRIFERLGYELAEEVDTLTSVTDITQVFKDNGIVALRHIFENWKRADIYQEINTKAG